MTSLRLLLAHVRVMALELVRIPAFLLPTMAFPALFFLLFAVQYAKQSAAAAGPLMLSYVAFAFIGVTLFQFGVGVSTDRVLPWERYMRTLSAPIALRFAARITVALLFALIAAGTVALAASLTTPVHFEAIQWLRIIACALIGAIPFTLFGLAIGYWTVPRAALPIANLCYLLLSFAGGLWIPPPYMPRFAQVISPYTPTRQFAELLWNAPSGISAGALGGLGLFALIFAIVAAAGYRRDERTRYG